MERLRVAVGRPDPAGVPAHAALGGGLPGSGGQCDQQIASEFWATDLADLGGSDRIIPVAHGYAAHDAVAGSRLEVLAGVGHFPHVESPTAVVEILDDFIATTGPMPI